MDETEIAKEAELVEDKVEEAKKILAEEEKSKQEAFKKELEEVCEKHGYVLDVISQIILKKK